jgi:uncharacterized repeat protein (TIGR03803 family)
MLANDNNLYGTTDTGGLYGRGTIFSYNPVTKAYTDLHDFDTSVGSANGALVQTADSTIYGLFDGRTAAYGGIFGYNPKTSTYNVLFSFNDTDGYPNWNNGMTLVNGKLYGMTTYGGTNGEGVIFRFNPANNAYSDLVNFSPLLTGKYPICGLTLATDGNLYGMLVEGGTHNLGTIISFNPSDSTAKIIYDLTSAGGCESYSGLTQVGVVSGINQLAAANNELSVFPNPAGNVLFLKLPQAFTPTDVTVFNALGQPIYLPFNADKSLDIENLPAGLYFVRVTDNTTVLIQNFVKQ